MNNPMIFSDESAKSLISQYINEAHAYFRDDVYGVAIEIVRLAMVEHGWPIIPVNVSTIYDIIESAGGVREYMSKYQFTMKNSGEK